MNAKRRPPKRGRAKIRGKSPKRTVQAEKFLVGTLKVHREGLYGFVLPEDPSNEDIFVPLRRMHGALDGDRVRAAYWKDVKDGRFEGGIDQILERGKKWLVGVLVKEGGKYLVECRQAKTSLPFLVDREDIQGARLGETVGIEVVDYPEGKIPGTARVIQLFGARGEEATEIDIVILKHQLPREFPAKVRQEAEAVAKNRKMELSDERKDLREIPLVTIDGETARDFDDAICVRKSREGFTLWVSIADVSYYIRPGSELDREALARGTSVYFPQKVIPMLPEELSNDLCSLRPHEDRCAFTAELNFDRNGNVRGSKFYKSLIRSQARLTYHQVAKAILEKEPKAREKIRDSLPMLEQAFSLFRMMRQKRLERGSIDFDLPEPHIILDLEEGNIEAIVKAERNEAHMLIEEFMVAANEAVAKFVTQSKRPMVYRVHPKPDPEKISNFSTLLHNLGFHQVKLPKNPSPKDMGRVLALSKGHVEEGVVQHFLLRSMKQAIYSPKNEGHFGLASDCYTHFTSPIRRYPDLVVHRILHSLLREGPLQGSSRSSELKKLESVTVHASRRERIAMEAEWEAHDLMAALFMEGHLGETFVGVVARVAKFGFFVELEDFFVQGLVLLEDIPGDYFIFDEKHHRLRSRKTKQVLKIGTEVKVQVSKVDIEERRVYFKWLK